MALASHKILLALATYSLMISVQQDMAYGISIFFSFPFTKWEFPLLLFSLYYFIFAMIRLLTLSCSPRSHCCETLYLGLVEAMYTNDPRC